MAGKLHIIEKIKESGIVAVIRAVNRERACKIAEACIRGGITIIEITMGVPDASGVINGLRQTYGSCNITVGAGTVLDAETARSTILAGAQFVVCPCLVSGTMRLCNRYDIPCIPGAMTVKEVVECMEAGADIVKLFPGELFGPRIIKAIKGPLPHVSLMPTGGVTVDNAAEWIKAGAVAVGAGGSLTSGDYEDITSTARRFISAIKTARNALVK